MRDDFSDIYFKLKNDVEQLSTKKDYNYMIIVVAIILVVVIMYYF